MADQHSFNVQLKETLPKVPQHLDSRTSSKGFSSIQSGDAERVAYCFCQFNSARASIAS
jgi:hypothetical protein